ncbi:DUF881 domain-containing protein [Streptacidiphilus jiangxiensis]|uniref:Uncharacterized conserved protein YlxW, UPF0749 family n=1 Tax=Streptacidiphilus jiangxiensis TaxID=235985 RepID=A0A1H7Y824_STRJI|nr:DUF881 domain-containing protein [Streptacidiphilus jiangxiensis]SEM41468.1 Uncharacterized conserved protein YlxW, UPF0749 family [Streptacidiphilus jiangxiensis]
MSTTAPRPEERADARYARPDASMSLLTDVIEHSLDDGYADEARRTGHYGSSRLPRTLKGRLVLGLGLAMVATILTIGADQVRQSAPVAAKQRQALIDRIDQSTSTADGLQQQVTQLQAQLDQARASAVGTQGSDTQLSTLQLVVGETPVSGPGVQVTVDDAASAGTDLNNASPRAGAGFGDTGRVRDSDLQLVVNALWQSGAEAIAINGERLTTLSAIRAAGDAILVNDHPLTLPYSVQAIGGPGLQQSFQNNAYGGLYLAQLKQNYQIRYDVSAQGSLSLPAASVGPLLNAHPSPSEGTKRP